MKFGILVHFKMIYIFIHHWAICDLHFMLQWLCHPILSFLHLSWWKLVYWYTLRRSTMSYHIGCYLTYFYALLIMPCNIVISAPMIMTINYWYISGDLHFPATLCDTWPTFHAPVIMSSFNDTLRILGWTLLEVVEDFCYCACHNHNSSYYYYYYYTPRKRSLGGGYIGFTLSVRPSVCPKWAVVRNSS